MNPLDPEAKKRAEDVCKKCREQVLWATTPNGKAVPIDPELVYGGNVGLEVNDVGMLRATVVRPAKDVEAYVTHFTTCPAANYFRKNPAPATADDAPDHDKQRAAKLAALQVRMPFGQYSGQTLEEIDREKKGHEYLAWALKGITWRRNDVRDAIALVLGVEP